MPHLHYILKNGVGYYQNNSYKDIIVFGNYNDDFNSVSSIAHELGHAMHSYYSLKNNPPHLSEYTLLVAEIASLTNEMLLSNYVINNTDDKDLKLYALSNIIEVFADNFFGTLSLGSVFEKIVHEKAFNGDDLSEEDFNDIYGKLIKKHNGALINDSSYLKYNWCRIPHFYTSFYVYKYSTGIITAMNIANRILAEGESAVKDYFAFLSGGSSTDPVSLLKLAGVDLTKSRPFEFAMSEFDKTLRQFEELMGL